MIRGLVGLFFLVGAWAVQAMPLTSGDLVNLAGRQRMLSQRIVKAYAQVGANVLPVQSRQILDDSIALFAQQFEQLQMTSNKPEQRDLLVTIQRLWPDVRRIASAPVDKQSAALLQTRSNELEAISHRLAGLIEVDGGVSIARLVNVAGRQRMLSQRLTKTYMLRAWNIDSPQIRRELESSRQEFSEALQLLAQAPENTPEIRHELNLIESQWNWFQAALELEGANSYRLVVADSSESMLASLEHLVALYARLGR